MKTTRITTTFLEEHDACDDQGNLFAETFPRGTRITRRAIVKAQAAGLNIEWFIEAVLPPAARAQYVAAVQQAEAVEAAEHSYDRLRFGGGW